MAHPVEKPTAEWVKLLRPRPCDVCGKVLSAGGSHVRYFVDGYQYCNEERFTCSGPCMETAKVELALQVDELLGAFVGKRTLVVCVRYGISLPVRLHFRGALYGDLVFAANTWTTRTTVSPNGSKHLVVGQCSGCRYKRLS